MKRIPLICIPFAGAGASFFHPWKSIATDGIEIVAVQLPGRERRIEEDPYRSAPDAVDGILRDTVRQLGGAGPVMIFGHSLGAVLAYELAHRLSAHPSFEVVRLIVSGSPGPWARRTQCASGLPDDEFLSRVQEFSGYSHEALQDAEMRALILPALRADVAMHEDYRPSTDDRLPAPITSLRGRDDHLVTADEAGHWAEATSRDFERIEFDGGHMYLTRGAEDILRYVQFAADGWTRARGGRLSVR
jgi:surfactin synthase thioesterase subunit